MSAKTDQCELAVGTSGYSYKDWVDAGFYPEKTPSARMLPFYSKIFNITEINHTWYQMPKADAIERQIEKSPSDFQFTAKLTRVLTHEIEEDFWKKQAKDYRKGISPLIQARKLIAILVQLPYSFDRSTANRKYLAKLFDELEGLPLAVEFRNKQWVDDKVFSDLEKRQIALVAVDEPTTKGSFPPLDVVTNPGLFYVRFHGRNQKGWFSGNLNQKFDYDYSDKELTEWIDSKIEKMVEKAKRGVIFFNNHVKGQAPKNAQSFIDLLKGKGFKVR